MIARILPSVLLYLALAVMSAAPAQAQGFFKKPAAEQAAPAPTPIPAPAPVVKPAPAPPAPAPMPLPVAEPEGAKPSAAVSVPVRQTPAAPAAGSTIPARASMQRVEKSEDSPLGTVSGKVAKPSPAVAPKPKPKPQEKRMVQAAKPAAASDDVSSVTRTHKDGRTVTEKTVVGKQQEQTAQVAAAAVPDAMAACGRLNFIGKTVCVATECIKNPKHPVCMQMAADAASRRLDQELYR